MKLDNSSKNTCLASNVLMADSFFLRLKGLLTKESLDTDTCLIIRPGNSIHTFFMKFDIDAIFLDKQLNVVGLLEGFKPFRISPIFFKSCIIVELPSGKIKATNTSFGDRLELIS
ncbi:MAG: DUF192 domain-containing protein [Candidatus Gygaella obscura]|nr:DUF192 domain-containing protein [Candidatus Gygaella obscura]